MWLPSTNSETEQWERLVRKGAGTWDQEWVRQALCLARKAAVLCVAWAPAGYWTIGMLDKRGQWLISPEADVLVAAVGVLEAIAWLARAAMRVRANGDLAGPGVDARSVKFYESEIERSENGNH